MRTCISTLAAAVILTSTGCDRPTAMPEQTAAQNEQENQPPPNVSEFCFEYTANELGIDLDEIRDQELSDDELLAIDIALRTQWQFTMVFETCLRAAESERTFVDQLRGN